MNAKELAGSISRFVGQIKPTNNPSDDAVIKGLPEWFIEDLENSATMLRQQADRIAELEEILDACQRQRDAWRNFAELFDKERKTTPQIKELSDEEITEVLNDENIAEYHQGNWLVLPYAFARAILKKASE